MKVSLTLIVAAMIWVAVSAIAQSNTAAVISAFTGTWESEKVNGLPSFDLKIEGAGQNISGIAIFYFQKRNGSNETWRVEGESPVPILLPQAEGRFLTFEVRHHKCHGCSEYGPNVRFRMELTGLNEARLWKLNEKEGSPRSDLKLSRRR